MKIVNEGRVMTAIRTRKKCPRGRTVRISLTHDLDLDFQSLARYDYDLLTCKSSSSKSVSSKDRVETNGRTDRGDCITYHINAVGNYVDASVLRLVGWVTGLALGL